MAWYEECPTLCIWAPSFIMNCAFYRLILQYEFLVTLSCWVLSFYSSCHWLTFDLFLYIIFHVSLSVLCLIWRFLYHAVLLALCLNRLAVTSRPIMVVLNKVDLLRGDYVTGLTRSSDGELESESESENMQRSSGLNDDISSVTSKDVKVSFKKKLLQRKRDAIAKESEFLTDSLQDLNIGNTRENIKITSEDTDRQTGSFFGNTDYSEYKDEYNEREGENSMWAAVTAFPIEPLHFPFILPIILALLSYPILIIFIFY